MKLISYDWHNTIMELFLGVGPMSILLWMSNGPSDFKDKIGNYIPSHEIQLLFVCYFVFGLIFSTLNLWLKLSKSLLIPSLDFISAFVSIGQAFAGFLLFAIALALVEGRIGLAWLFAVLYYGFHVAVINLKSYEKYLKQRHKWVLKHG